MKELIYTGPVDSFFDYRYGKLPYRSLHFKHETHNQEVYQTAPVVNFPNEHLYTRVTEFKYLTGQEHSKTAVVYEYPRAEGDPYYPIPKPENAEIYTKYKALADKEEGVRFVGRLATYRYYNMDQVVAQALTTYAKIEEVKRPEAIVMRAAAGAGSKAYSLPTVLPTNSLQGGIGRTTPTVVKSNGSSNGTRATSTDVLTETTSVS